MSQPRTDWAARICRLAGTGESRSRRLAALGWVVLACLAVAPIAVAEYPPLLDYHQWVFQAHLIAALLRGGPGSAQLGEDYALWWAPIPNLASSALIGLMAVWLPAGLAGRVFLAGTVLLVAGAFGYLVRSAQRQPTAVEFLGFVWAYGYFLYNGFVSYLFSLPLALLFVASLLRAARAGDSCTRPRVLVCLTALSVATYLAHLFGWLVVVLATAVWCGRLVLQRHPRAALALALTHLPAAAMLVSYAGAKRVAGSIELYSSLPNKLVSLVGPLLPVLRVEPFAPLPFAGWLNLALLATIGALVAWSRRPGGSVCWYLLGAAALLFGIAGVVPFSWFAGLGRPDERFTLPALLLGLAAVRYRTLSGRSVAVSTALVAAVLIGHGVEYSLASQELARTQAVLRRVVQPGDVTLSVAIHEPPIRSACQAQPDLPSLGVQPLQWFATYRQIETQGPRVNTFDTALLIPRFRPDSRLDLMLWESTPESVRDDLPGLIARRDPDRILLLGCRADIQAAAALVAERYGAVEETSSLVALARRPDGAR